MYTPGARRNCLLTRTTTKRLICDGPPIEILKQPSLYLDSRAFHLVLAEVQTTGFSADTILFRLKMLATKRKTESNGIFVCVSTSSAVLALALAVLPSGV